MEILTSERKYSRDIGICLDVFLRPLLRHARNNPRTACLTDIEASILECNLERVHQSSKVLLRALEYERSGAENIKTIGKIFMDEADHMRKSYVEFVSGYRSALDLHSDLLNRAKKKGSSCSYHSFIKNAAKANNTLVLGRSLEDFYILPVQRVPRYRLLLQELLKRTPSRYDRAFVKEAIKRISIVADEMNYRLRKTLEVKSQVVVNRMSSSHSTTRGGEEEQLGTIEEETEDDTASLESEPVHVHVVNEQSEEDEAEIRFLEHERVDAEAEDQRQVMALMDQHHTKEAKVETWLQFRNWKGENLISAPTANSFALYAIANQGNPWRGNDLNSLNATSLATQLQEVYNHFKSQPNPYRPMEGDIIVCGPVRSGQTPILQALDCFRSGTFTRDQHSVLDRVGYLGWDDWDSLELSDITRLRHRILKSHQELKAAFGGSLAPAPRGSRPTYRVIATLRHPADLRMSYFRHLRRMFRKLNPEMNFDRFANLDEFANCLADYEQFCS